MPFPLRSLDDVAPTIRKQFRKLRRDGVRRTRLREIEQRRLVLSTMPAHVSLEMTARCNLNCVHCRRFHFQQEKSEVRGVFGADTVEDVVGASGYLEPATFERCMDLVRDTDTVELAGYGEPMMNPHFHEYAQRLKRRGLSVNTITNGTLLTQRNVEQLVDNRFDLISVSIDGFEEETLRVVRGIERTQLFAGLARLKREKEKRGLGRTDAPRLSVSFVMARFNIREMASLVRGLTDFGLHSFYAQNLETVNAEAILGPQLIHTDAAVRAEAMRHIRVVEAFCHAHDILVDIQHIPHGGEGWEPPGVGLDVALRTLADAAGERTLERREYLPLAEIEADRRRAAGEHGANGNGAGGVLEPPQTANHIRLTDSQERENDRCLDFFRYAFVAWNGRVLSCCFERHAVGDLNVQTAGEAWNGAAYRRLRRSYFEHGIRSICDGCAKILD